MTTCFHCHHASMRHATDSWLNTRFKAMAKLGFVACAINETPKTGTFVSFSHRCDSHLSASETTTKARDAWAAKHHPAAC